MKITITRTGYDSTGSPFEPKQDYELHLNGLPKNKYLPGHIEFGFNTNAGGQRRSTFHSYIMPEQFSELASVMMQSNPSAAIKAFGAALQNLTPEEIEKAA